MYVLSCFVSICAKKTTTAGKNNFYKSRASAKEQTKKSCYVYDSQKVTAGRVPTLQPLVTFKLVNNLH